MKILTYFIITYNFNFIKRFILHIQFLQDCLERRLPWGLHSNAVLAILPLFLAMSSLLISTFVLLFGEVWTLRLLTARALYW